MSHSLPVVAVVGRPNVGKSTFFNRVLGGRLAIVDDTPGVTRDRNFALADWAGRSFYLVDTGGVIDNREDSIDDTVDRLDNRIEQFDERLARREQQLRERFTQVQSTIRALARQQQAITARF